MPASYAADDFYPFIAPFVPGVSRPYIEESLRRAIIDFCEKTGLWRKWLDDQISVEVNDKEKTLALPSNTTLVGVICVQEVSDPLYWDNGDDADESADYTLSGCTLVRTADMANGRNESNYYYTLTESTSGGTQTIKIALSGLIVGHKYTFSAAGKDGTEAGSTMTLLVRNNADDTTINSASNVHDTSWDNRTVSWIATETNNVIKLSFDIADASGNTVKIDDIRVIKDAMDDYSDLLDPDTYQDYHYDTNPKILFDKPAEEAFTARVRVALKPTWAYDSIQDWMYRNWVETLASGAMARLFAMTAQSWANVELAALHDGIYRHGISRGVRIAALEQKNKYYNKKYHI